MMEPQYHYANGGWPVTQNVYARGNEPCCYEENPAYGMNAPYGIHAPYGTNGAHGVNPSGMNPSYENHASYGGNLPYGQNVPYGANPSYEQNVPYGANLPYGQNVPYGANPPYGQNVPHGANLPYGQNVPYRANPPYEQNTPYVANPPYEQNTPYVANPPYEQNVPYRANPPYGQNVSYGANSAYKQNVPDSQNVPYGANLPYGQNTSYGMNPPAPYGQNLSDQMEPPYGGNLPSEVKAPYGGAIAYMPPAVSVPLWQQGVIEPYQNRYQIAPNNARHTQRQSEKQTGRLLLFSMAGAVILAFLAIMIGIVINDDGTGIHISEAFASWVGRSSSGHGDDENASTLSFITQSTETVRGEMFAVGEDGSIFLRTKYGICRVAKNDSGYEYNGWAAELDPDMNVRSMAVYGDYLYIACGEYGIFRVNTARSNTFTQIIDDDVTSFVIAEDNLFYLSMEYPLPIYTNIYNTDGYFGELYIAGLNGKGSRSLGQKVRCAAKYRSSADFVFMDGYLYFFDEEANLRRMRADGTRSQVVVEHERQKPSFVSCGLYENGGVLYFPSARDGGIYAYDVEADRLKKVSSARLSFRAPILFVGNALLYREEMSCVWHQIKDGQDTVYESPLNDGELWLQAVGAVSLFAFHEQNGYYDMFFLNGEICSEKQVVMDYDTMPAVDIEEDPDWMLQATVQADCRAAHLAYVGSGESSVYERYVIFQRFLFISETMGRNTGLVWTYVDEDGEHTDLLVDGEVKTFFVENDVLYYTKWDEVSESAVLFRADLVPEGAVSELLVEGISEKFALCGGMIYYVDQNDGKLYRYNTADGEAERISDDEVGCYDIWNGMIYYENRSASTLCKMRLDGTDIEEIDTPYDDSASLRQLTVCPYMDNVYLAVVLDGSLYDHYDRYRCLFAEDGSMELSLGGEVGDFDRKLTLYYRDGRLYYSSDIAYEIRVFDFAEYFDGGNGGGLRGHTYDTVFCEENMNTFEVTDEFVYVQMYMYMEDDINIIKVFDRQTGELVEEIHGEAYANL